MERDMHDPFSTPAVRGREAAASTGNSAGRLAQRSAVPSCGARRVAGLDKAASPGEVGRPAWGGPDEAVCAADKGPSRVQCESTAPGDPKVMIAWLAMTVKQVRQTILSASGSRFFRT